MTVGSGNAIANVTFTNPEGVAVDGSGNVYVADTSTQIVYKLSKSGSGFGTFTQANYSSGTAIVNPLGLAFDNSGNLFVANGGNGTVAKVDTNGNATTFVSTGSNGITAGSLPRAVAVSALGFLYVAYSTDQVVRVFNASTGAFVGSISTTGFAPQAVNFDQAGNLYIAENSATGGAGRLAQQAINQSGGQIGLANGSPTDYTSSSVTSAAGLAFDQAGNLYVSGQIATSPVGVSRVASAGGAANTFASGFSNPQFLATFAAPAVGTPEPSSLALLSMAASAMAGYGWWGRRRRQAATSDATASSLETSHEGQSL